MEDADRPSLPLWEVRCSAASFSCGGKDVVVLSRLVWRRSVVSGGSRRVCKGRRGRCLLPDALRSAATLPSSSPLLPPAGVFGRRALPRCSGVRGQKEAEVLPFSTDLLETAPVYPSDGLYPGDRLPNQTRLYPALCLLLRKKCGFFPRKK